MASYRVLIIMFVAIVAITPMVAVATDFIVGDAAGWTVGYDYKAWANGKDFRVGDNLIFIYPASVHNVFKVNGTAFKNCDIPSDTAPLSTGNDTIHLATPGRKWYICGQGDHCDRGQKLVIVVQQAPEAPAMSPTYPVTPSPAQYPVLPSPAMPPYPAAPPPYFASSPPYPVSSPPYPAVPPPYPAASPPYPGSSPPYPSTPSPTAAPPSPYWVIKN